VAPAGVTFFDKVHVLTHPSFRESAFSLSVLPGVVDDVRRPRNFELVPE